MSVKTMTRMIRVYDNDSTPIDVSIDFSVHNSDNPAMFFEIDQDSSVYLTIEGIEAVLEAAKLLKAEYEEVSNGNL